MRLERVDASWSGRYVEVAHAVVATLGDAFEGGVVEAIAHVGGTAVPGLLTRPIVEVIVRVHPWPLAEVHHQGLARLGLERTAAGDGWTRYARADRSVVLDVVSHEYGGWGRRLALRDHLRAEDEPRRRLVSHEARRGGEDGDARADDAPNDEVVRRLEDDAVAWLVRTTGFTPLVTLHDLLEGVGTPWAIGGGWALDLASGAASRPHDDLDLVLDRADGESVLRHLVHGGYRPALVESGRYQLWRPGDPIPSTVHQVHARVGDLTLDVALEPRAPGTWFYRRDPSVQRPIDRVLRSRVVDGRRLVYLAPEVVLLFKARTGGRTTPRAKDDDDARRHVPALAAEGVAWLRDALERTAPGHGWLTGPVLSRRS